jgi:imidazolonepropionase-like amidohydrolase
MKPLAKLVTSVAVLASGALVYSQGGAPRRFVTPPAQVIAIRAGRMFDSRTGTLLSNQVIVIRGDRISDVGAGVAVPAGAQVIDLSAATVLPGMIDAHVHLYPADNLPEATRTIVAVANAQTDLNAGFTTVLDMDTRGGYGTVDLRNAINNGLVMGPRMQVVGQSLNQRASSAYPAFFNRFQDRFT